MPVCHNDFLATGAGDGGRSGEGFQTAAVGEASPVVADLGQHPGTGQAAQPGEACDDRGVRVLLKMGDRRLGQFVGSGAGGVELAQQRGQLDPHCVFDQSRLMQVGGGEHRAQSLDIAVEVTAAASLDQQTAQPSRGKPGGFCRSGRGGQEGARVAAGQTTAGQLGERHQCGRVEILEQVSDLVADLLAAPHGVLLGAGEHPDGLGQVGISRQRSMRSGISAHNVGQQHRVGGIGFCSRQRVPSPIARGGQRVDRIDHPAGGAQRAHPQPAVGFDSHRDRMLGAVARLGQQRQRLREPGRVVADEFLLGEPDHGTQVPLEAQNSS